MISLTLLVTCKTSVLDCNSFEYVFVRPIVLDTIVKCLYGTKFSLLVLANVTRNWQKLEQQAKNNQINRLADQKQTDLDF